MMPTMMPTWGAIGYWSGIVFAGLVGACILYHFVLWLGRCKAYEKLSRCVGAVARTCHVCPACDRWHHAGTALYAHPSLCGCGHALHGNLACPATGRTVRAARKETVSDWGCLGYFPTGEVEVKSYPLRRPDGDIHSWTHKTQEVVALKYGPITRQVERMHNEWVPGACACRTVQLYECRACQCGCGSNAYLLL